ncbi:MAG: hypothetical protein E6929_11750 [Clostridium sp.]|nr:hypothetical protein [Clostridium sp.]
MTALNFILDKKVVILSMDTLVTFNETRTPVKMTTKFLTLPNMNCIICGTGNFDAIIDWFSFVQKSIIANGIYQLNKLSEQALPNFMKNYTKDSGCTIYQFGLNEIDKDFYGYVYRSTNNFKSEQLSYGLGIKPTDAFIESNGELNLKKYTQQINERFIIKETLYDIMKKQKEYDDNLTDVNERVGIGGMVQIVTMNEDEIVVTNYKRFDDYEKQYKKILTNC